MNTHTVRLLPVPLATEEETGAELRGALAPAS